MTPPTDRRPTPTDRRLTPPTDRARMTSGGMPPDPRTISGGMPTSCSGGMPDPRKSSGGKPTSRADDTTRTDEGALSQNFGMTADDPEGAAEEDSKDQGDDGDEVEEDSENRDDTYRRKKGSGLAGKVISALMMSANALAGAAHQTWTNAIRHNRVDFAEVCCTADSQLSGEAISRGGSADRYSNWNGFDLTTRKGADALRNG